MLLALRILASAKQPWTSKKLIIRVSRNSVLRPHAFLYGIEMYVLNSLADAGASFWWYLYRDENLKSNKFSLSSP